MTDSHGGKRDPLSAPLYAVSALRRRGWCTQAIRTYLPTPDALWPTNSATLRPSPLYDRDRVHAIEATEEWQEMRRRLREEAKLKYPRKPEAKGKRQTPLMLRPKEGAEG